MIADRGAGPYSPMNHNFATMAKVAYWFWHRYEYTSDRDGPYSMLRSSAEFHRRHPLVKSGEEGPYYIHWNHHSASHDDLSTAMNAARWTERPIGRGGHSKWVTANQPDCFDKYYHPYDRISISVNG